MFLMKITASVGLETADEKASHNSHTRPREASGDAMWASNGPQQTELSFETGVHFTHNSQTRPRDATGEATWTATGPQTTELSFDSGVHFNCGASPRAPSQRSPVLLVRVDGLVVRCYMVF